MTPLVKGLVVGFAIAAPVGPIGLLCLRRSLTDGRLTGFVSGLGAATADAVYGSIAALGLTAITQTLNAHQHAFQLLGGLFLIYIAVHTYRSAPPVGDTRPAHARNLAAAYASTLALTLANPATIVAFTAILATMGFTATDGSLGQALVFIASVFVGSALWWLFLSSAAGWFRDRLSPAGLRRINHASGLAILLIALWQLGTLAWKFLHTAS